jgi:hypothetical protein
MEMAFAFAPSIHQPEERWNRSSSLRGRKTLNVPPNLPPRQRRASRRSALANVQTFFEQLQMS